MLADSGCALSIGHVVSRRASHFIEVIRCFLFIFESIGTSELILVGIVALIFLGPRRCPNIAKKIGKIMAEFRGTANEFKETWQREVNFDEEAKAFDLNSLEAETRNP